MGYKWASLQMLVLSGILGIHIWDIVKTKRVFIWTPEVDLFSPEFRATILPSLRPGMVCIGCRISGPRSKRKWKVSRKWWGNLLWVATWLHVVVFAQVPMPLQTTHTKLGMWQRALATSIRGSYAGCVGPCASFPPVLTKHASIVRKTWNVMPQDFLP